MPRIGSFHISLLVTLSFVLSSYPTKTSALEGSTPVVDGKAQAAVPQQRHQLDRDLNDPTEDKLREVSEGQWKGQRPQGRQTVRPAPQALQTSTPLMTQQLRQQQQQQQTGQQQQQPRQQQQQQQQQQGRRRQQKYHQEHQQHTEETLLRNRYQRNEQQQLGQQQPYPLQLPPPPPPQQPDPNILTMADMQCSASDFSGLSYQGLECHASNIWPGGPCPIQGACLPPCSRCVNWRRGRLPLANAPPLPSAPPVQQGAAKLSPPCDSTIWGFGAWKGEEWAPSESYPQCGSAPLTPVAIYHCLKGKRLTFFGDSMIRPLMGRLIAYLRTIPQYIDHLFHEPGGYYMANGTHDVFVEGGFLPSLQRAHWRGAHGVAPAAAAASEEASWDPPATVEMQLFWAPHFTKYDLDNRTYPSLHEHLGVLDGSDVMVAGPMYHEGGNYETVREHLLSYFQLLAQIGRRIPHFFWVATIPFANDPSNMYGVRNAQMRTFIEMLNERALHGDDTVPRVSYYVDAARMSHTAPMSRADVHHYQCNKHGIFPGFLTSDFMGIAESRDCRDMFNLNVVQSILKVACSA